MKKQTKKMIAPIVIVAIIVLYFVFFGFVIVNIPMPLYAKILAAVIPLLLAGTGIFVLVERINEIRSGEEDDLSKY